VPFKIDPSASFTFGPKRSVHVGLGQIPANCNSAFIIIIAYSNEVTEIVTAVLTTINLGNKFLHIPITILENFIWIFCITVDAKRYEIRLNHISLQAGLIPFISRQGMRVFIAFTSCFRNTFPRSGIHISRTKLPLHRKVDATLMRTEMTAFIFLYTLTKLCLNSRAEIFYGT